MRSPTQPLCVIIPFHNEAEGVPALAERMRTYVADEAPRKVELVLVDDGSTDATHELLLTSFDSLPCTILRHDHNRGLTAALATGLEATRTDFIGWLDSDLTYDPAILTELAAVIETGADIALASCYHPEGRVVGVPPWRLLLSSFASRAYRRVTGYPIHTFTSMVRVYRRSVLEQCKPTEAGFLGITDVLLQAIRHNCKIVEVPATLSRRRVGQSKMKVLRVGLGHLRMMAACRLRPGSRGSPRSERA